MKVPRLRVTEKMKKKNPMGEWWRRMREKVRPSAKVYSRKRKWKESNG